MGKVDSVGSGKPFYRVDFIPRPVRSLYRVLGEGAGRLVRTQ